MPLYPGLLISTERNGEKSASSEIHFVLTNKLDINEHLFRVRWTRVSGLVTVKLDDSLNGHQLIRKMMDLEKEEPYFMHCLKIRPVDRVIPAEIEKVVTAIEAEKIDRQGSFRITVNKRHTPLSSMDLIEPIAELFGDYEVDLEQPDWEIWIEVVADQLGYAIIEPELVFSTDLAYVDDDENVTNWFLE